MTSFLDHHTCQVNQHAPTKPGAHQGVNQPGCRPFVLVGGLSGSLTGDALNEPDDLGMSVKAGQAHCIIDTDPPQPLPVSLPTLTEQARAEARIRAFGSREVLELFEAWRATLKEIIQTDYRLELNKRASQRGEDSGIDGAAEWRRLERLRSTERDHRKALMDRAAKELEGRSET
jgi:hypothetical protein